MRTWTLKTGQPLAAQPEEALVDRSKLWREQQVEGPVLWDSERVTVIELEPVLDLLERVRASFQDVEQCCNCLAFGDKAERSPEDDVDALLTAHKRS